MFLRNVRRQKDLPTNVCKRKGNGRHGRRSHCINHLTRFFRTTTLARRTKVLASRTGSRTSSRRRVSNMNSIPPHRITISKGSNPIFILIVKNLRRAMTFCVRCIVRGSPLFTIFPVRVSSRFALMKEKANKAKVTNWNRFLRFGKGERNVGNHIVKDTSDGLITYLPFARVRGSFFTRGRENRNTRGSSSGNRVDRRRSPFTTFRMLIFSHDHGGVGGWGRLRRGGRKKVVGRYFNYHYAIVLFSRDNGNRTGNVGRWRSSHHCGKKRGSFRVYFRLLFC